MPYADPEKARACQRLASRRYRRQQVAAFAKCPELKAAHLVVKRRNEATRRAKKRRSWLSSPSERIAACLWRLHNLAPDGDLYALRERILKETHDAETF